MEFPKQTTEYKELKEISEAYNITYGPYQDASGSNVLGLNIFGPYQKICSFACPYCYLGPTQIRINQIKKISNLPTCEDILSDLKIAFRNIVAGGVHADRLIISGLGEPTLHPQFAEIVEELLALRNELIPKFPITILSNGAHLGDKKILKAVNQLDEKIIKLDAGSDNMFVQINAPLVRSNLSKIISNARKVEKVIIQSFFVQGRIDNTLTNHISEWIEAIGMIAPSEVHISSLTHIPDEAGLIRPVPDVLHSISAILKRRTQVEVKVFS